MVEEKITNILRAQGEPDYIDEITTNEINDNTDKALDGETDELYNQALNIIETYNGVIIADVVGLGKSIIASLVANQLGKRGLILCPPGLIGNRKEGTGWWEYKNKFKLHNWEIRSSGNLENEAETILNNDLDYEVIIVDEHTGRLMAGRRWSEGLHQAVEAKEGVEIKSENQTLASITFQNYFRLYQKLAGMTGTAMTESEEFHDIYKLNVVSIPTNRKMLRKDFNDQIFRTEKEKYNAITNKIIECNKKGQPVLVGTTSIEKSEKISISKL